MIAEHYALADEIYPARQVGRIMRKFGIKYAQLHPQSLQVRDAFIAVKEVGQWKNVLDRWYTVDGAGLRPQRSTDLGCGGGQAA